jgi:hypothetical protein
MKLSWLIKAGIAVIAISFLMKFIALGWAMESLTPDNLEAGSECVSQWLAFSFGSTRYIEVPALGTIIFAAIWKLMRTAKLRKNIRLTPSN